ncbi:Fur family transcriptional regulator [Silvibacterium sp.]|uniref:Fur family transcriptional regulator n=1 Tax=Silvibacterium sp. TaxID=1964179 RepID=UPI0039E44CFB
MKSEAKVETRNTPQKDAIRAAFVETDRPISAEEILSYAKRSVPDLSIATVYRNLKILTEDGWLEVVQLPGETPRYERSGKEHHHHFLCQACRKVYELEGCVPKILPKIPRGFPRCRP